MVMIGAFMKTGIELITEERQRQIKKEGWTPEHDDSHTNRELALMAAAYATASYRDTKLARDMVCEVFSYFGDDDWFKPCGDIRMLEKAGALIAAEIDRLQREAERA